ncbi:Heterotrimeric G-protein alpha subunit 4 [Mycena kentingensis (nom. inval.)]|nr:Heterotrimeric G-protein alpha subunit 4 [Mycena kentingensis (nom. inval.)]
MNILAQPPTVSAFPRQPIFPPQISIGSFAPSPPTSTTLYFSTFYPLITMGNCASAGPVVSEEEKQQHQRAEKSMKETKARLELQSKILLLGSGDSGKSTVLKQMRLINNVPFSPQETEHFRQLLFDNITGGLKTLLAALPDMQLDLVPEDGYQNLYSDSDGAARAGYVKGWAPGEYGGGAVAAVVRQRLAEPGMSDDGVNAAAGDSMTADLALIETAPSLRDGDPFPLKYLGAVLRLWNEPIVQQAWVRANEAALPENLPYLIASIPRLFAPGYAPTSQDIVHSRVRTTGITETAFKLKSRIGTRTTERELLVVDVGGQKSERRKWIHCFQDVTSILFLVSLSGYDQCLFEDHEVNQMRDSMAIWESICSSQWFKDTSIILFLNKDDLFQQKILTSPLKPYFPEYDGPEGDVVAARKFFKQQLTLIAIRSGRSKDKEVYLHVTNATDTAMLTVVLAAVTECYRYAREP